MAKEIGIGMIGYAFMGKAHSNGWRQVPHFFDVPFKPVLKTLVGRNQDAVKKAAKDFGFEKTESDWKKILTDDDIQIVDICAPGNLHKPMAIAALEAGKHVVCEKPLANTLAEAREMAAAAKKSGKKTLTAYNYRRVPAVSYAKQLIEQGVLGEIYHWRAVYLQDWIMDPNFPLVWRLQKDVAGSGPHGDLNSHITDLARWLIGDISEVTSMKKTFIKKRPIEEGAPGGGLTAQGSAKMGDVTVEDAMAYLAKFENGAFGTFEATRFAGGRRNFNSWEINGSKGSLTFNLERLNELEYYNMEDPAGRQGFRTILCNEGAQPYNAAWWPSGHVIGWEHTFTHEFADFLNAIANDEQCQPDFVDGAKTQAVLEAVMDSADSGKWEKVQAV